MLEALKGIYESSAFSYIIDGFMDGGWKYLVMYGIVAVLFYLGIVRKFEPLLLLPIAFGMLLTNIPTLSDAIFHMEFFVQSDGAVINWAELGAHGGLLDYLYLGVKLGIFPPLIFLGVGAMTDFSPLIANPKSLLLGAAAQFGVFAAFIGALLLGFTVPEAASIGIIGGADGPTAIYVTKTLAPALLGAIAVAAYSYMALVPMIQPPIMKALTTKKERMVKMDVLRPVSKTEQVIFPIVVALVVSAILPSALSLVGMLMLGNLLRVSGVTERLSKTAQNELMNIVTIMLGVCVGATAKADTFLDPKTLYIILLGLRLCNSCRRALRQADVYHYRRQDQSSDRFRRRFRSSHGSSCFPEGWPGREPLQLPADARYGSQRGRRYRLRSCGRRIPDPVPVI